MPVPLLANLARYAMAGLLIASTVVCSSGCRLTGAAKWTSAKLSFKGNDEDASKTQTVPEPVTTESLLQKVSYSQPTDPDSSVTQGPWDARSGEAVTFSPPTADDFDRLTPWYLTLDEVVRLALDNSPVIRDHGGKVLAYPDAVRTTLDPAVLRSDPNLGIDASLAAFDTQFETGFVYNGGGNTVNSAFSGGQFGVFAQPETLAKVGFGKVLSSGTKVSVGGVGGYDEELAGGLYAAYGAQARHPLMRGAGKQFNQIAGPLAKPGMYRGVLISQIEHRQARFEVEQSVSELVRDVAIVYWELFFAYQNLEAKRAALESARQVWEREQQRVAQSVSPADLEALARQQYYSAEAGVRNAICGTAPGRTGVYDVELKLRTLLALPMSSDCLICPVGPPLAAPIRFDWNESDAYARINRIELRKQQAQINKRVLEVKAARNLQQPQVDLIGAYRRLADDPAAESDLFSEALQGWQLGVEYSRPVLNRRENAAVHNAQLQLCREQAIAEEQARHVSSELRSAFIELDRAYGSMNSMAQSRDAANVRLNAQSERHAAGDVHVEDVLEAQIRAMKAETEFQRSLVDYNVAFIKLHQARGTLLHAMGVGFGQSTSDECRFALNSPSVYSRALEWNPSKPMHAGEGEIRTATTPSPATVVTPR
ncbi:TolC family protein [Aporhodopirellula aestuarii]|uniref:TolC family protein n=1 Tax=Aporhodopirellula aestuarii TaxID=2950107 RepID=A0ABT0U069_9BACT|nr:TolC family protein [Aporhodopirellula aestuarii]MCM2370261.1 TolC family protein [Aporhodopirellula aestuarii]